MAAGGHAALTAPGAVRGGSQRRCLGLDDDLEQHLGCGSGEGFDGAELRHRHRGEDVVLSELGARLAVLLEINMRAAAVGAIS